LCVISNTRRSGYGYDQRIEAFGSAGMVTAGNLQPVTVQVLTNEGVAGSAIEPGFPERYRDAYRNQIHHFADVLHGRCEPQIGYADGVAALVLAEACERSLRTGTAITL
jgi:myo-inositol 2-dehydrogenase/D-chiro-inositol 1-dehydrogenase